MAALIAGPVCFICIIAMVVFYVKQQRRFNDIRRIPYEPGVESNSLLMPSQQTLHELLDEWSNSGSGSGEQLVLLHFGNVLEHTKPTKRAEPTKART